ncbi:MAG: AMP-binding protein [Acidimicrobiales bacterium]|nr:AMP-binding protein [Acidimicrobiales bacterium]
MCSSTSSDGSAPRGRVWSRCRPTAITSGASSTHAVTLTSPKAIVVHAHYVDRFLDVHDDLTDLDPVFLVVGTDPAPQIAALERVGWTAMPFSRVLEHPETPVEHVVRPPRSELGALLFTSGTTGPSKAVMMSHAHLYFFANEYVSMMRLTDDDVLMTDGPMFHGNAQFFSILPTLVVGATSHLYRKFSPNGFADRAAESGATVTNWVGVMMDWVAKQPEKPIEAESKLRAVFACPTAFTSVDDLRHRYGIESFNELFGQTETGAAILTPYGCDDRPPGAAGLHVSEWFDIRLVDPDTDEDVPVGEIGELVVRPKEPWVINLGYFGMPEASLEARRNLWFHTGDGMRQDEDGWFSLRRPSQGLASAVAGEHLVIRGRGAPP